MTRITTAGRLTALENRLDRVTGLLERMADGQHNTPAAVAEKVTPKGKGKGKVTVEHVGAPNHKVGCKCPICARVQAKAARTPAQQAAIEAKREAERAANAEAYNARKAAVKPLNKAIAAIMRANGADPSNKDAWALWRDDADIRATAFESLSAAERKALKAVGVTA